MSGQVATPGVRLEFRPNVKKGYRTLEKALLKYPKQAGSLDTTTVLDCRRVLDMYGVLVVCDNYVNVKEVLQELFESHRRYVEAKKKKAKDEDNKEFQILRLKNRCVPWFSVLYADQPVLQMCFKTIFGE